MVCTRVTLIWSVLRGGKGSIRPKVRFENSALGHLCRQTVLGTQIKVSTYSNVLSVVRSVFISVGRIFMRVLAYLPPAMLKVFDD